MNKSSVTSNSLVNVNSNLKWNELLNFEDKLVLIVDDEKDLRKIISYNLEQEGIKTIEASDGDKAINALNQKRHAKTEKTLGASRIAKRKKVRIMRG